MKTGVPSALKCSASTRSVTVLPVPVAPAIKPWRFAMLGGKRIGSGPFAIRNEEAMESAIENEWSNQEICRIAMIRVTVTMLARVE
jgi:hypothetical protein